MINGIKKETIVSTTEDRLTLLNWLKKLEKTLSDDTLTDIAFTDNDGNVSLTLTFEDGTTKSIAFPYNMSAFAKKEDLNNILKLEVKTESFESFFTKTIDKDGNFNFDLVKNIPNGLYIYRPEPNLTSGFEFKQYITMIVFGHELNGRLDDLFYSIVPYPNPTTSFGFSKNNQSKKYYIYVIGSIIYIDEYWEI